MRLSVKYTQNCSFCDHLIVMPPFDVRRRRGAEPGHARQVDGRAAVHVHVRAAKDLGVRLCSNYESRLLSKSESEVPLGYFLLKHDLSISLPWPLTSSSSVVVDCSRSASN